MSHFYLEQLVLASAKFIAIGQLIILIGLIFIKPLKNKAI
jgi:hypothetical protein